MLGARVRDAEVGATDLDIEVPATSMLSMISAKHLVVKICDAETCYLDAMSPSADPRVKDKFTSLGRLNVNFL